MVRGRSHSARSRTRTAQECAGRSRRACVGASCAVAVAAATLVVGSAQGSPSAAKPKPITASLVDFKIKLSRATTAPGSIVFRVSNRGAVRHDLVFVNAGGKRTRILQPGQKQTITVPLRKPGVYRFYCSIPGHRALGMQGSIRVGDVKGGGGGGGGSAPPPVTVGNVAQLTPVANGLAAVTDVTAPPGDTSRIMVVQQNGLVTLLKDGAPQTTPFLDLRGRTRADGEKGLLSLAFAPDYDTSGLLYVDYTDTNGDLRVVELHRSTADPDVADPGGRELLRIIKPTADHNGGMLQFGPDGYLYIAVGDGGADPPRIPVGVAGQTLDDLLGSILRIDPRRGDPYSIPPGNPFASDPSARPEIVAYGLRNPWRFWIDAKTGAMLIGDVGEGEREEIDRLPLSRLGLDFGWPCKEGTITPPATVPRPASCATATVTPPIYEYAHSSTRCSITGGVTSRDPRLPALDGLYLWSDLCDGGLYVTDPSSPAPSATALGLVAPQPTTFGVDGLGRVYVGTAAGDVYRVDPR